MRDRVGLLRAAVLGAWALFFGWLWVGGEMTRYLGPRTYWVIAFGAIALGLAALAHVAFPATTRTTLETRHVGGAAVMVIPIVAVLVVPSPELGSLAASRRSASGVAGFIPAPQPGEDVSFRELHYASESEEYAASAGVAEGMEIELTGFVTHDGGLRLTRFYVSCCAADAIPYSVPVTSPDEADYPDDTWLHVAGTVEGTEGDLAVIATLIRPVEAPDDPYLY